MSKELYEIKLSMLDDQLGSLPLVESSSWTNKIRKTLRITLAQMAKKMGVSPTSIAHLERSEASDTISLKSLRKYADELDCDLVYYLKPRSTLSNFRQETANKKFPSHIALVKLYDWDKKIWD